MREAQPKPQLALNIKEPLWMTSIFQFSVKIVCYVNPNKEQWKPSIEFISIHEAI